MLRLRRSRNTTNIENKVETDEEQDDMNEVFENDNTIDIVAIPNASDLDIESEIDSDDENEEELTTIDTEKLSYHQIYNSYNADQKKLEEGHQYVWVEGEKECSEILENVYLLTENEKIIRNSSPTDLFSKFFSKEMKNHIIKSSMENDLVIPMKELDIFIGIILLTVQ